MKYLKSLLITFVLFSIGTYSYSDDNDISDFSFSKVRWLNSADVGGWQETSQIDASSVEVRQNGQICVPHSKADVWTPKDVFNNGKLLMGNSWIIVNLSGQYYAATYEWLGRGQVCKFGHQSNTEGKDGTTPLSAVYQGNESIGAHIKTAPLDTWQPRGGEVVGFMVSGLARNNVRNEQERSNVVWYRLPPADGHSTGQVIDSSTDGGGTTPPEGGDEVCDQNVPNQCLVGEFSRHPRDTTEEHLWSCRNLPNGAKSVRCSMDRSEDEGENMGKCGRIASTCSGGDFHPFPPDTATLHRWSCRNRPHNGQMPCEKPRSEDDNNPELGRCSATFNHCDGGELYTLMGGDDAIARLKESIGLNPNLKSGWIVDGQKLWVCRNTQTHYDVRHTGEIWCPVDLAYDQEE